MWIIKQLLAAFFTFLTVFIPMSDVVGPTVEQAMIAPSTLPYEVLAPEVISVRPHDPNAFTQGLLLHEGVFYESAGQYAESTLREVDPETGEVLRSVDVPPEFFAEGLALVGDTLIQLTWREQVALVYDRATFAPTARYSYQGEGWGLCYDGEKLYMSDGSSNLFVRDPATFELLNTIPVTLENVPVHSLNELECVGDSVYANIWLTDVIVRIDKTSGNVTGYIDAAGLLTPEETAALRSGATLNGIAYAPDTGHFFITGKYWPKLFEVTFVPVALSE